MKMKSKAESETTASVSQWKKTSLCLLYWKKEWTSKEALGAIFSFFLHYWKIGCAMQQSKHVMWRTITPLFMWTFRYSKYTVMGDEQAKALLVQTESGLLTWMCIQYIVDIIVLWLVLEFIISSESMLFNFLMHISA